MDPKFSRCEGFGHYNFNVPLKCQRKTATSIARRLHSYTELALRGGSRASHTIRPIQYEDGEFVLYSTLPSCDLELSHTML